jgi:hypothetical protein
MLASCPDPAVRPAPTNARWRSLSRRPPPVARRPPPKRSRSRSPIATPFRTSTTTHAPQASILFDKFHVLRHLSDALDTVRKSEYARLAGKDRRFIKGQKYTLLAHRENLTLEGKKSLALLLAANKRLNTSYLLKENFGQLWSYRREAWTRRFFEHWRASLKWQRLKPFDRFAAMIERHWAGIAAYCQPENTVALRFVEGLNNKIRVLQRRRVRPTRRGVPAAQDPHHHARAPLAWPNSMKMTHTNPRRPIIPIPPFPLAASAPQTPEYAVRVPVTASIGPDRLVPYAS